MAHLLRRSYLITLLLILLLGRTTFAGPSGPGVKVPSPDENAKAKYGYHWSICDSCAEPESVYYDSKSDLIFVSNVVGIPDKKDGNGFIQTLDVGGKIKTSKWVTGLNGPKGMRSREDTLWLADIDEVVAISIKTGKIRTKVKVKGAKFLNDVAVGADGTVYVSDTMGGKIFSMKGGKASVFAEGEGLESPNGLLVQDGKLVVAAWGSGLAPDWSTKTPGHLYSLDLITKEKKTITAEPLGNLDGIEVDNMANYLVSDWNAGKVFKVSREGKAELLFYGFKGAADIAFVPGKNLLIVPRMGENLITAFNLSEYPLN